MKNMTQLIEKIDLLLAQDITASNVRDALDQFNDYRERLIFKAKINQENKMTPEILEVFIEQGV